jgi:hypothetical protein
MGLSVAPGLRRPQQVLWAIFVRVVFWERDAEGRIRVYLSCYNNCR